MKKQESHLTDMILELVEESIKVSYGLQVGVASENLLDSI